MKTYDWNFRKAPRNVSLGWVLTVLILLFNLVDTYAQSAPVAIFNSSKLEHNVMHDGEKCLKLILDVNVKNAKGKDVKFTAYVESPKGVGHRDANGRYCTVDHNVSFSKNDEATYDNTRWRSLSLYLPNSEIHPMTGENTYYIQVQAKVEGKLIGSSDYVAFTMEGRGNNVVQGNAAGNRNASADSNVQKITCIICHGTGKCSICGGMGYTVSPYGYLAGQPVACGYCTTSGKCPACFGRGFNVMNYSNGVTYIDGKAYYPSGGGSSSSGSSRRHNNDRSSACSLCGGTGVNKTPNSGGSRASWVIYHNSEGSACPYCNSRTNHFHDRCARCNVPSY